MAVSTACMLTAKMTILQNFKVKLNTHTVPLEYILSPKTPNHELVEV